MAEVFSIVLTGLISNNALFTPLQADSLNNALLDRADYLTFNQCIKGDNTVLNIMFAGLTALDYDIYYGPLSHVLSYIQYVSNLYFNRKGI